MLQSIVHQCQALKVDIRGSGLQTFHQIIMFNFDLFRPPTGLGHSWFYFGNLIYFWLETCLFYQTPRVASKLAILSPP